MKVKIDTKEKFTVLSPVSNNSSDNIAAELTNICNNILHQPVKNIVLNMTEMAESDENFANTIADIQQQFYENNASFVICNLNNNASELFDRLELTELLNITPTESEAWDIVQMEEIERELLDGDDISFEKN